MSILSAGIDESPIPGRSGAITVNFSASKGIRGRHIREVSANSCNKITVGPWPAVRYCSSTLSAFAVRETMLLSDDAAEIRIAGKANRQKKQDATRLRQRLKVHVIKCSRPSAVNSAGEVIQLRPLSRKRRFLRTEEQEKLPWQGIHEYV